MVVVFGLLLYNNKEKINKLKEIIMIVDVRN